MRVLPPRWATPPSAWALFFFSIPPGALLLRIPMLIGRARAHLPPRRHSANVSSWGGKGEGRHGAWASSRLGAVMHGSPSNHKRESEQLRTCGLGRTKVETPRPLSLLSWSSSALAR